MIEKYNIKIEGMTCASCVARIEKVVLKLDGVINISVNLATEKAMLEFDNAKTDADKIIQRINTIGFHASQINENYSDKIDKNSLKKSSKLLDNKFYISAVLTILILILSMVPMIPFFSAIGAWRPNPYIQMILSLIILIYGGKEFYTHAFKNILTPDMDSLVTMGSFVAWIYSTVLVFTTRGNHLYFEATGVIITFVLLGRNLEKRAKKNVAESVNRLMDLAPKTASVLVEGIEKTVKVSDLQINDIVVLKPGFAVPTDGIITSESVCYIDESMLTGESKPIQKKEDDEVFAGTVILNGWANFKVSKLGKDTVLASIIQTVTEASSGKAKIQRIADKIASFFVPAVILIAVITLIIWYLITGNFTSSMVPFVSVIVIACPCALGLAIPTAIITGVGRGAKEGILIKNGEVLERAANLHICIFDKTGTITTGDFSIIKIIPFNNFSEKDIVKSAAAAEEKSDHPIALSIVKYAYENNYNLEKPLVKNFENFSGSGIKAKVNSKNVILGNKNFLQVNKITLPDSIENNEENTEIFVAIENIFAGIIFLGDTIKNNVKETIKELQKLGITSVIVSGDNEKAVSCVAKKLKILDYFHSVSPTGKMKIIKDFQDKGKKVVMVGDGINDAAALASSDIGIALATGTDIAIASGDITIMGTDLAKLPVAFKLAKKTAKIIKENLFWAFIYNIIAIPIAAGVFYHLIHMYLNPAISGIAMAFSSLTVVSNSLRLKTFKLK